MISGAVGPGDKENETQSIWLTSILGGQPRKLRAGGYRAEASPDGSKIAYMFEEGIWVADADGDDPRELVPGRPGEQIGSPDWSPDGRRVAYRRRAPGETRPVTTIESRALDESTSTLLLRDAAAHMAVVWLRDFILLSDRLIYAASEPAPRNLDQNFWELTIDPESGEPVGEPRRLTDWVGFSIVNLSATADESVIAFGNSKTQDDVFIGELAEGGRRLDNARRFTLDDRRDSVATWTPDGSGVVFETHRRGTVDLFVQQVDQRDARSLAAGPGDQRGATRTPDGRWILYWEMEEGTEGPRAPRRLFRIPVEGGPTERIHDSEGMASVECASTPDGSCFLLELNESDAAFVVSRLKPEEGKGPELWRVAFDPGRIDKYSLSPDGTLFAVMELFGEEPSIRLLDAETGEPTDEVVMKLPQTQLVQLVWSHDGSGFFAVAENPRAALVVHIDLEGETSVLFEDPTGFLMSVVPSPDGRRLAFTKAIWDINAWTVEGL